MKSTRLFLTLGGLATICGLALALVFPDDRRLGHMYESDRQYPQAVLAFERWVGVHPLDKLTRGHLADLYLDVGDAAGALRTLDAMIRDWPDDPDLRHRVVDVYHSRNQIDPTLAHLEALSRLVPEDANVAEELADLYRYFGREKDLIAQLERILALDPRPSTTSELLELLLHHGEFERALRLLEPVVKRRPDWPQGHSELARVLIRLHRIDDAVVHLTKAVNLQPDLEAPFDDLVTALVQAGRVEAAIRAWRTRLDSHPYEHLLRRRLAEFLMDQNRGAQDAGDRETAIEALERTLGRSPSATEDEVGGDAAAPRRRAAKATAPRMRGESTPDSLEVDIDAE